MSTGFNISFGLVHHLVSYELWLKQQIFSYLLLTIRIDIYRISYATHGAKCFTDMI